MNRLNICPQCQKHKLTTEESTEREVRINRKHMIT